MNAIDWHQRARNTSFRVGDLIDGKTSDPEGDQFIHKYAAHDGTLLYSFKEGANKTVNQAVQSARQAFTDGRWRNKTVYERQAVLNKLADLLEENREQFALYECLDVGKPISAALEEDVFSASANLRKAASGLGVLLMPSGVRGNDMAYQHRKPIGVVVGIIGWNFPLVLATAKIGPALAMGNSVVIKPSEFTALSALRLAQLALEAGVPPGVLNIVQGAGSTVGAALASHMDVDMITFTGSTQTGKRIMAAAALSNMKRVHLECGGKSPYLVFDDCPEDLDWMAHQVVASAFPNQGALCISSTRLLVQAGIKDALLEKIVKHTQKIKPQDPLNPDTRFGAIMNEAHMQKVLGYVESGKAEGATYLCGGEQVLQETGGFYLTPAIFDQVKPEHRIAREEIFGPLLSTLTFNNEEEALQLANNSDYGLAAYVATTNLSRAHRVAQNLNAGLVIVSGSTDAPTEYVDLGMEPHRQSGMGYEDGIEGLEAFSVTSAIHMGI